MGHGPARELETNSGPTRELAAGLANKLTEALSRMDLHDDSFRDAREEERQSQLAKRWGRQSKEILEQFREITRILHQSHQLSLDVGADGGGRTTQPWVEETAHKFERLFLKLEEDGSVLATSGPMTLARSPLEEVNFDWLEKLVVVWVVKSIDAQTRGGLAPRYP
ncbi:MAG: hypothetical protein AAGA48_30745 [Myxococcota bacterium]